MNKQVVINVYKQLFRFCRLFDEKPVLKYVLSDTIKKAADVTTKDVPNWFSPELSSLTPHLIDEYQTYYPAKSAVSLLRKRFQPLPIPTKETKFVEESTHMIQLCENVLESARSQYRLNLLKSSPFYTNDSIAFTRDKVTYDQIHPTLSQITRLSDVQEGMLVMNYPTILLSSKSSPTFLSWDDVLLITKVTELCIQGVVLNPKNARMRSSTYGGHSLLSFTKRKNDSANFKQFVVQMKEWSTLDRHAFEMHSLPSRSLVITPEIDVLLSQTNESDLKMARFDQLVTLSLDEMVNSSMGGDLICLQCDDLSPFLFNETLSRRTLYSNLLFALGGEWTSIAPFAESLLF